MSVPPYTIVDAGTDLLWEQFADNIKTLKWAIHDNLILSLLPSLASIRCVFARKDDDGSFLGGVVWSEVDDIAWIGMYICIPEVRGNGIGSRIWERAMKRIRETGRTIGLTAVDLATKYKAIGLSHELSRRRSAILSCVEMRALCSKLRDVQSDYTIALKSTLTEAQIEYLLEFDEQMTGRNRRNLLVPFLASPSFECAVVLNAEGRVTGWAGVTSTGFEKERLFKLAPIYASSLAQFAALTEAVLPFCERMYADAKGVIYSLSGTVGERELEPLLGNSQNIERVTLFSNPIDWRLRKDMCFAPHNCVAHFDG